MFKRKYSIVALILCIVILLSALSIAAEPFKTKLNLFERLVVMGLLPQTGNFATLKIVTEANMMLGATDEESVLAGLEPTPEGAVLARKGWDKVPEKEFIFKETLLKLIKDALTALNEADPPRLTMEHFRVYEKFMIVKEEK
ncbi:MAG: hypothetical protein IMF19_04095 [Proteobacteria bacterium]|nr:hypothetical protein [Pseudomonadota bacterium]